MAGAARNDGGAQRRAHILGKRSRRGRSSTVRGRGQRYVKEGRVEDELASCDTVSCLSPVCARRVGLRKAGERSASKTARRRRRRRTRCAQSPRFGLRGGEDRDAGRLETEQLSIGESATGMGDTNRSGPGVWPSSAAVVMVTPKVARMRPRKEEIGGVADGGDGVARAKSVRDRNTISASKGG